MKILYVCLAGDETPEDISLNAIRYSGSSAVPKALLHHSNLDFYYAGSQLAFKNLSNKQKQKCIPLSAGQRDAFVKGFPVESIIPNLNSYNFDLIFHAQTTLFFNTQIKQAIWAVGFREEIHQYHKHILLFAKNYQQPQFNSSPYIYEFVLGTDVPKEFKEYKKENYGLVVGNQRKWIQSAELANLCNQAGINCYFAGPVDREYKDIFLPTINNQHTFYLGEITSKEKMDLNKHARCIFQLHTNFTSATLAAKECLSVGTPVIATPIGQWVDFIKHGVNGFLVNSGQEIVQAYGAAEKINQLDCYNFIKDYSTEKMVDSLVECFNQIIKRLD